MKTIPVSDNSTRESSVVLPSKSMQLSYDVMRSEAGKLADEIVARMPNFAPAHHVRATYFLKREHTNEAEESWKRCIEIEPRHPAYYLNLIEIALQRGKPEESLEILRLAEQRGATNEYFAEREALAYSKLGKLNEALEILKKATVAMPENPDLWLLLGQTQLRLGELNAAEQSFREASRLGMAGKKLLVSQLNCALRQRDQEAATGFQAELDGLEKEYAPGTQEQFNDKRYREALELVTTVLAESVLAYASAGDLLAAENTSLRWLTIDSESVGALLQLSEIYRAQSMFVEELATLQRLCDVQPHHAYNYLLAARAAMKLGDWATAEALGKKAIALKPKDASGYLAVAEHFYAQQRPLEAVWFARKVVELEPTQKHIEFLAKIFRSSGQEQAAQRLEDQAGL